MELSFVGQAALPFVVLLTVGAAVALGVIATMIVGLERMLLGIAVLSPAVVWFGLAGLEDGGVLREFLHWVVTRDIADWLVLGLVVTFFAALVWYQTDNPLVTGCFLPLTALFGLLAGYLLYATNLDVIWQMTGPGAIGGGATVGAALTTWILVGLLRAAPQQID